MGELCVRLLGTFQIVEDERPVRAPVMRRAQALLALMLLAPGRRVRREVAADAIWPEATADVSRKGMRQALWQIHHLVDDSRAASERLVLTDASTLQVNPERRLHVDADEFTAAAQRAGALEVESLDEDAVRALTAATELYRGPLLDGWDDEWCLIARARMEDLHIAVLDRLFRVHERQGRIDLAIAWAQRLLDVEPAHEASHRRLMRLYYQDDDRTRALRQYARCRHILETELGIKPSGRTQHLAAVIEADRPVPPVGTLLPAGPRPPAHAGTAHAGAARSGAVSSGAVSSGAVNRDRVVMPGPQTREPDPIVMTGAARAETTLDRMHSELVAMLASVDEMRSELRRSPR